MSDSHLQLVKETLPKILATVRQSVGLAAQDVNFYKSLDKDISFKADHSSERILNIIQQLIQNIDRDSQDIPVIDKNLVGNSWKNVGDVLDGLFEKSDIAFDEYKKSGSKSENKSQMTYLEDSASALHGKSSSKRIEKPQLSFKTAIDNSESHPFTPKIKSKPNAIEPFSQSMQLIEATEDTPAHHKQPYEVEIDQQEYPESILTISEPIPSQNWQETGPIWVDTITSLQAMIDDLKGAKEIAVDLEHHDYRTYYGIVSLMQISNREKDWIVDTLALRDDLEVLNVIFTDPQIIKVFHGAFMDIIWLQRDLGLYIVSLFDTYHASRLLGFPKHSLAYLLEKFAHFKTSKKYQLADWRIRPLPEAMMSYARSDTHFLLNIFDQLKNQLIQQDKLKDVLHESRKVAKRRFEYTKFRPTNASGSVVSPLNEKEEPWRPLMYQYNLPESKRYILVDLYNWRDAIARRDDESVRYVMPNQLLVSLVADAPTDSHGVLASGNFVSDYVRINSKEIANIIKAAVKKSDDEDTLAMSTVHDAYEEKPKDHNVDSDYINSLHHSFDVLLGKTKNFKENDTSLIIKTGGFIVDHQNLKDDTFSVEYNGGNVVRHIQQTPYDRLKLIDENFITLGNEKVVISAQPQPSSAKTIQNTKDDISISETKDKEQKPNSDEVITLRENKRIGPSKKLPGNEEAGEIFDYSSAKKLIVEPSFRDKSKKPQKKRSFDPYSKESEGPKAPKKVARLNAGKTSSFKNKR